MQLGNYVLCVKSAFKHQGHHVLPTLKTATARGLIAAAFILDRHNAVLETSTLSLCLRLKVGRKIPPPVFTGGIYRYFLAWQIRLKWQILANNGKYNFFVANTGKYDVKL